MTVSFEALITPLTRQEVEASIYQVLAAVGVNTTIWKRGSVVRTIITGTSVVLSAVSQLQAKIARSGFLELSEGDWLTLVAHHVYGVDRIEATFAEGEATLVNAGYGIYELDAGDLVVANVEVHYRNTTTFRLGAQQTLTVPIRADEAGSGGSALAGQVNTLVTTLLGVTCSNAVALIGRDAESDPDLRERCYEKLGALSPMGPWDAYAFAARSAKRADGLPVGVTRVRQNKDGAGGVYTWVATASGEVTGDAGDESTDLGAVAAAIASLAVPEAVTSYVRSARAVMVPITYEVWAYEGSGLTDSQLRDAIAAKLAAFTTAQPIGGHTVAVDRGYVFRSQIIAAIASARSEIFRVVVPAPASDVVLDHDQVPVLGVVSGTIHQVPAVAAAE